MIKGALILVQNIQYKFLKVNDRGRDTGILFVAAYRILSHTDFKFAATSTMLTCISEVN